MKILLSYNEIVWCDDSVSLLGLDYSRSGKLDLEDSGSESLRSKGSAAAVLGASKSFILKLGSALLQLDEEGKFLNAEERSKQLSEIDFEEKEVWMLRELAQSSAVMGKEPVGMSLKLKVHKLLRDFAAQETISDMGYKDSEEHDIPESDLQDKFIAWREKDAIE